MRIVTWNMQGGTNAVYLNQVIQDMQPNVLCLQETGDLTPLLQGTAPVPGFPNSLFGNYAAGHGFYEVVFWRNNLWTQGGVAIMSNIHPNNAGILAPVGAPYVPPIPRSLPWMEVTDPATGNIIRVFSIHSPPVSNFPPAVTLAQVLSWNNAQIAAVNGIAGIGTWAVVGDFNADPTVAGFVAPPAGIPRHGPGPTQQAGGILDYAITNAVAPGPALAFANAGPGVPAASDHYPQGFTY